MCSHTIVTSLEDGVGKTKTSGRSLQMKMHSACVRVCFVHTHLSYWLAYSLPIVLVYDVQCLEYCFSAVLSLHAHEKVETLVDLSTFALILMMVLKWHTGEWGSESGVLCIVGAITGILQVTTHHGQYAQRGGMPTQGVLAWVELKVLQIGLCIYYVHLCWRSQML